MIQEIDIDLLKEHPRNIKIYGEEDDTDLLEQIKQSAWIKPLVITQDFLIISGNRRRRVGKKLEYKTLQVEVRHFADENSELEALLLENAFRNKTPEQKVREAEV